MRGSANTGWNGTDSHIHYHFPKHPLPWKPMLPFGMPKAMWAAINNKLRSTISYESLNPLISQQYCFEDMVAYFFVEEVWRFEVVQKKLPQGIFSIQKLCNLLSLKSRDSHALCSEKQLSISLVYSSSKVLPWQEEIENYLFYIRTGQL